jgi:NAD(P)-dependent dehydrogenase (short-subunit alcohol dehydrogenase family)
VVIAARDTDVLAAASELIRREGGACVSLPMDVRSEKSVESAVRMAQDLSGGAIDVLINNAGMSAGNASSENLSEDDWLKVLDVNLNGYFRLGKAAVKGMIARGTGKVVNISSVLGLTPTSYASPYCVSKSAINQLTKAWAIEWARYNIQVNALAPGFTATDMNRDRLQDERFLKRLLSRIPAGRLGSPEDLLGAVIFLASAASDYVTGTTLPVDGGWSSA